MVSPILLITLRDKSLGSGYFRAAHQLLAANEFRFAPYEADVRVLANPAGVTGMCSSMHAEIKRTAIYPEEARSVTDFMKDMRAQYQTSLGLGRPFQKDSGVRSKKQNKSGRGRSFFVVVVMLWVMVDSNRCFRQSRPIYWAAGKDLGQ